MKNSVRVLSLLLAFVLCASFLSACGSNEPAATKAPEKATTAPADAATEGTEPFVAPPDAVGLVTAADIQLITWQAYATEGDTIDFKSLDISKLGEPAEMSLFYLENEVTFYDLTSGKLVETTVESVVTGSVIGVTTLEEGVQEVYILYAPPVDDGSDDMEDPLEFVEETMPIETTAPADETPEEDTPVI